MPKCDRWDAFTRDELQALYFYLRSADDDDGSISDRAQSLADEVSLALGRR